MNEIINYAIAIVVAIIGTLSVATLIYRVGFFKEKSDCRISGMKCTISKESIEKCILPNNRGKSIDEVFQKLETEGIVPEFHIDLT